MPRATPLPPQERRAAIIAATIPLLQAHGLQVSTKQIAEAAGVAEGTLFRVFPNKESLVRAAIESVIDPAPAVAELEQIDATLPLEDRLIQAVSFGQARVRTVMSFFHALGETLHQQRRDADPEEMRRKQMDNNRLLNSTLARMIEPDQDQLSVPAEEAARLLSVLTFSLSVPWLTDHREYPPEQIVQLLLHGITMPAESSQPSQKQPRKRKPHAYPITEDLPSAL